MKHTIRRHIAKVGYKLQSITAVLALFGTAVAFSPHTASLFEVPKLTWLAFSLVCLLITIGVTAIAGSHIRLYRSPFLYPLLAWVVLQLLSSWYTPIQFAAATSGVGLWLVLGVIIHLLLTGVRIGTARQATMTLLGIAVTLSLSGVLEMLEFGPSKLLSISIPGVNLADSFVSLTGNPFANVSLLLTGLVVAIVLAVEVKKTSARLGLFAVSGMITAGLVIQVFMMLPNQPANPQVLGLQHSWEVATDVLKRPRNLLIGVGPHNYLAAFTTFKPYSINLTENWNQRYTLAANLPLQLLTTGGILGLAVFGSLMVALFRQLRHFNSLTVEAKALAIAIGMILTVSLLTPTPSVMVVILLILMGFLANELSLTLHHKGKLLGKTHGSISLGHNGLAHPVFAWLIGVPLVVTAVVIAVFMARYLRADIIFRQSLIAANNNDGTATYNLQRQAIGLNPLNVGYRRNYATTNLSIADALSKKSNITDTDKQTITTLIRQSIREAQTAISLEPANPINWETLSNIYRQLMTVATDAPDWAITSLSGAIQRDPRNPRLRLELGGLYYQLGQYQNAIRLLEQAVSLKPDYANAYYNLANAYLKDNNLEASIDAYDKVLSLVEPGTPDYTKALTEQNQVREQLGGQAKLPEPVGPVGSLSTPTPLPSPVPEQQIELSAEDAPPADATSETEPEATGSASPSETAP